MKTEYQANNVTLREVTAFSVGQTLECGQCFRWQKIKENTYCGIVKGKILTVSQPNEDTVIFHNCSQKEFTELWYDYFDLSFDYDAVGKEIAKCSPILYQAWQNGKGIRILQQDSWEVLCSFIISQNNNIPRIKGIVQRLCENFGEKIAENQYTFPSAEKLSHYSADDLSVLRSGFRAKYIADACRKTVSGEGNLKENRKMSTDKAREELMKIKGVGRKVADCTLLYGMGKKECFPIDVWISKAMKTLLPTFRAEDFGGNAGIVQQYIYDYSRKNPNLFK